MFSKLITYVVPSTNKKRRANQYKFWAASGEPQVIWLSGLHIPESYLTALVQVG